MTQDEIKEAGEKAYEIERGKGNILDVNSAVAFKLGWDAAERFFTTPGVVSDSFIKEDDLKLDIADIEYIKRTIEWMTEHMELKDHSQDIEDMHNLTGNSLKALERGMEVMHSNRSKDSVISLEDDTYLHTVHVICWDGIRYDREAYKDEIDRMRKQGYVKEDGYIGTTFDFR